MHLHIHQLVLHGEWTDIQMKLSKALQEIKFQKNVNEEKVEISFPDYLKRSIKNI